MRLSGLPTLLMGANLLLLALVGTPWHGGAVAGVGVVLFALAFRIRAGHAAWPPVVLALYLLFLLASGFGAFLGWTVHARAGLHAVQIAASFVVPLICAVLAVNGLVGWRWLRANGVRRSY